MNGIGKKNLLPKSYDLTPKQLYLSPVRHITFASCVSIPFKYQQNISACYTATLISANFDHSNDRSKLFCTYDLIEFKNVYEFKISCFSGCLLLKIDIKHVRNHKSVKTISVFKSSAR